MCPADDSRGFVDVQQRLHSCDAHADWWADVHESLFLPLCGNLVLLSAPSTHLNLPRLPNGGQNSKAVFLSGNCHAEGGLEECGRVVRKPYFADRR